MKILVVLPRFPYPLEKGDKLRAFYQIRELSKQHDIYLFCLSHKKVAESERAIMEKYCKKVVVYRLKTLVCYKNIIRNWFASKSLQMGYWDNKTARRKYKTFEKEVQPDVIYNQMVRTMPLVARSKYPKVMDFQDALSMNTERRMDFSHGIWHYILHYEFKMLRSSEYNAFKIFDNLTIISDLDSEAIPHRKNGEIKIVPNGVDVDFFNPTAIKERDSMPHYDIVFCGNMGYSANINAVLYLVKHVMPLVWQQRPSTTLLLAGAQPKHRICSLADNKRVFVSGWVEDIRTCYADAKVFVAPMQTGSGMQNKLLEAMAMKKACVTTSIAADAIHAKDGEQLLIGDTEQAFANNVLALLSDPKKCEVLAQRGYDYVHENYCWEKMVDKLDKVLTDTAHK